MPVVVKIFGHIISKRRRPLPEIQIHLRRRLLTALAYGGPLVVVERTRKCALANNAFFQPLHRLTHHRIAPPLIAHLHSAVMLACCLDHQFGLARVVAARFFNVNMLACIAGQDGCGSMPVIGQCE